MEAIGYGIGVVLAVLVVASLLAIIGALIWGLPSALLYRRAVRVGASKWHALWGILSYVGLLIGLILVRSLKDSKTSDADDASPLPFGEPSMPTDISAKLRQLAALRDAGIVSQDDFQIKKEELLRRL